jgi:ADP-ribose pyrophosphatase YjhB (NUDIX family)
MAHPLSLFAHCPKCGSSHFEVNDEKSKKCSVCKFVYYLNPSAAVGGFIFNSKNELLVCRRAEEPVKGTLDVPGGFVDMYESAENALIREIKEELNLDILESNFLFSLPNNYPFSGFDVPTLDLFFKCKVDSFEELESNDDVSEAFFIPLAEVKPEDFGLTSVRKAIEIFLQNPTL